MTDLRRRVRRSERNSSNKDTSVKMCFLHCLLLYLQLQKKMLEKISAGKAGDEYGMQPICLHVYIELVREWVICYCSMVSVELNIINQFGFMEFLLNIKDVLPV